jgi:hypothetical protein
VSPAPPTAAARIVDQLAQLRDGHGAVAADPALGAALSRLRGWQSRRLRATYADLAQSPRYAEAIAFFQDDLYGPGDFSRRDADLARIVPVMTRMLPARMLEVVADATDLNALSFRLDRALLAHLPRHDAFDVADYCRAYRRAGDMASRTRQIELIGTVGHAIDRYGGKRSVRQALHLMRVPARAAGFAALQDFLERGFVSFARMDGADEFLAVVDARERAILEAIVAGSDAPFLPPPVNDAG